MFTVVKYPQVIDRRRSTGEPRPEIISHRDGEADDKKWPAKMRNEENTYKHLRQHRDALLESEILYKKTIKELEKEKAELINVYEPTYQENKVLKSILEHGPDAVKMKKLQKARKELQEEVEKLNEDNQKLTEQINDIMKKDKAAKDFVLEKNWNEILASSRKNKDKREMKVTQGPFPVKEDIPSSKFKSVTKKEDVQEQDMYDLELDSVEKEIQIVLNNVQYLKKQKKLVDNAVISAKGAVVRNSPLENAIYDKLDKDLNAFKGNLQSVKEKHDDLEYKLEASKKDAETKKTASKDLHETQILNKQFTKADKNKSYKTSETQTEVSAELQHAASDSTTDRLKSNKKRYVIPRKSRVSNVAVQTDFPQREDLQKSKITWTKYLDQNEEKNIKLPEKKQIGTIKASSKNIALEYAKKLVVRRNETLPGKTEMSKHVNQESNTAINQDIVATDHTKQSTQPKGINQVHANNREMQVHRPGLSQKAKNSRVSKYESSQDIEAEDSVKHTTQKKRNTPGHSNYRDMFQDRTRFPKNANNSHIQPNVRNSKKKSRSLEDLDKQLNLDYRDKIMIPGIDSVRETNGNHGRKSFNSFRRAKKKSERFIGANNVEIRTQISRSLPSENTSSHFIEDTNVLKRERHIRTLVENKDNENRSTEVSKYLAPRKDAHAHLRADNLAEEKGRPDESAYNEVLFDLKKQYKLQRENVYQDFQNTAQNFRHYKGSVRENHKLKNLETEYFPNIVPHASLKFTTDSRQLTGRDIRHLLQED